MSDTFTAPRPKIPIFRTAYDGYRLAIGAIFSSGAMFRFFVYGSLLIIGIFGAALYLNLLMTALVAGGGGGQGATFAIFGTFLFGALSYVLIAAAQTPLGLLVHQQVLLGDSPKHSYFAYVKNEPGQRFFVASIAIYAIFYVAGLLHVPVVYFVYGVNPLDEIALSAMMTSNPSSLTLIISIWFLAALTAALISVRCAFAFPIVASGRQGSALRQSFVETRGTMWRLFFVFVLIYILPCIAYLIFSTVLAVNLAPQESAQTQTMSGTFGGRWAMVEVLMSPQVIVALIVVLVALMLSYVATAAAAARAYDIRVERGLSGVAEVFS